MEGERVGGRNIPPLRLHMNSFLMQHHYLCVKVDQGSEAEEDMWEYFHVQMFTTGIIQFVIPVKLITSINFQYRRKFV